MFTVSRAALLGHALGHDAILVQIIRCFSWLDGQLAEREGFEPPIRLPVCRISSAVRSTTLPPLRGRKSGQAPPPVGRLCIQRPAARQGGDGKEQIWKLPARKML